MKNEQMNPDIQQENIDQKQFLENSVKTLSKRIQKEAEISNEDRLTEMNENLILIDKITSLRQKEQRLVKGVRQARAKNAEKTRFLQGEGIEVPDFS